MSTATTRAKKPSAKAAGSRKAKPAKGSKKASREAQLAQFREQVEKIWAQGEKTAESLWHETAVASLHWISSHHGRVDSFKKSVKGTVLEKPLNNALKAIRSEAKAPAKKAAPKKAAAKKPAASRKKTTAKKT